MTDCLLIDVVIACDMTDCLLIDMVIADNMTDFLLIDMVISGDKVIASFGCLSIGSFRTKEYPLISPPIGCLKSFLKLGLSFN